MANVFNSLNAWSNALITKNLLSRFTGKIVDATREEMHQRLEQYTQDFTPVSSGKLKASWKIDKKTGESQFKNVAAHAIVINRGRKRDLKGKKMLGSPQAPRGITIPVTEKIMAEGNAILTEAASKIDTKI